MPGVFITATGTGVGKTFLTAGLIRHLRRLGRPVRALKPVVSGFDPEAPSGSDPAILLEALGHEVIATDWEHISPWRFLAPLSPDMAAQAENRAVDFEALVAFCEDAIADRDEFVLIEGIGGVMVPLDGHHTVLDWMARLDLPIILVAGTYLGTLSHVLTAQEVVRNRRLDLRALVLNETEGSSVPLDTTLTSLGRFAAAPLLGSAWQEEPDEIFLERLVCLI